MNFNELIIQGFKSFRDSKTFVFPDSAGFYFLTGQNLAEPELEGNGTGKTSMWDALVWVLYGKTCRGLKASDIGTWSKSNKCVVTLKFEENGVNYELIRTWSPNSLKLSAEGEEFRTVTQEDVEKLTKLDYDSFLFAVLYGQAKDMFFDLKPAIKSELFSTILNLEDWDLRSAKAKSRVNELELWYHDTKEYLAEVKGRFNTLKELDFTEKVQNWEKNQQNLIENLKKDKEINKKELENLKNEGELLIKRKQETKEKLEEISKKLEKYKEIDREIAQIRQEVTIDIGRTKTKLEYVSSDYIKFFNVVDNSVCPECGQKIDKKHLQKKLDRLTSKRTLLIKALDRLQGDIETVNAEESINAENSLELRTNFSKFTSDYRVLEMELRNVKDDSQRIVNSLKRNRLDLINLENAENPYLEEERKHLQQLEGLEKQIKESKQEVLNIQSKIEAVRFWIKGFKEVRLYIISEVLTQLELEVNNSLYQLGLKDWKIEFAVDAENKSGGIKKGFTVLIYSPYNSKPVVWESWSGGESQRLRLAGTLGLSNLILARNGASYNLEVFDEPSAWLSPKGVQNLLETLDGRARELQKQIWIIDHTSLGYGGFDKVYTVIKDKKGSHFEETVE